MVGFNRRWSPAVLAAQKALAEIAAPKFLVYRVAAGPVPDGHWYADRRQGGRLLGEVCHFVDTAQALIGAEIEETVSVLGGQGAGVVGNDAVVSMRFADGSLATICYGSALPTAAKEVDRGVGRLALAGHRRLPVRATGWQDVVEGSAGQGASRPGNGLLAGSAR
jgi:predicted dehydrogenase